MILPQVAQVFLLYWVSIGGYIVWLRRRHADLDKKLAENK
jgi:hypothetical protein